MTHRPLPIAALLLAVLCCVCIGCDGGDASDKPAANQPPATAQRSPFPEPGEQFTKPLPYKKLSDIEQFSLPIDPDKIPAVVQWTSAKKYVGHTITVQGRIAVVGRSRDGKVHFLNFAKNWQGKFYMVLFNDLAKTLDKPVDKLFTGKLVRVRGKVETYRGKPQIRIRSMDQVEFVDR